MWHRLNRDRVRALRRKKLIRKLFFNYVKNSGVDEKAGLRIIDRDDFSIGSSYVRHYYSGRFKVVLDLVSLYNQRIYWGYSGDYYPERPERLAFIKGNKKIALRFVLLHELGHILLELAGDNTEYKADSYAIEQLQKEGLLKC